MTNRMNAVALAWVWLACCGAMGAPSAEDPEVVGGRAKRYVIGLSPFLDREVKDPVYRQIVGFLLEGVPLNSSVWIYDAYRLQTIAQVEVPGVRAFRSAKTRANQFQDSIREIRVFLAESELGTGETSPRSDGAIRFPQFLDFVGDNLSGPGYSVVMVVLGGPLYVDEKEPGFSMVAGYYPSDGHLRASRERSVFGLQGRGEALRDSRVHFGWFGDPWMSEGHREKVERFWSLYLGQQGARLAVFCGDLPTVFNTVREGGAGGLQARHDLDPTATKVEMLRITREVGVADWLTQDLGPNRSTVPPTVTVGVMKVGLRWRGDLDLDLYACPREGADTLFFQNMRSTDGYYFKDHRTSPEREYEFVEFEVPVDAREVEALVNFYAGHSPGGVTGEARVEFAGRIFAGQFCIEAERGNEGRSGGSQARYWTTLDIPLILGLRDVADLGVTGAR